MRKMKTKTNSRAYYIDNQVGSRPVKGKNITHRKIPYENDEKITKGQIIQCFTTKAISLLSQYLQMSCSLVLVSEYTS